MRSNTGRSTKKLKTTKMNVCVQAAGITRTDPCVSVKQNLELVTDEDKINAILREISPKKEVDQRTQKSTKDYGIFGTIGPCLRPQVKTRFQEVEEELQETVYGSHWNEEVGKTRDPTPGLPKGMKPMGTLFGKPTEKSAITGGMLITPKRTAKEILQEHNTYHGMYTFSHADYNAGEQISRNYGSPWSKDKVFGIKFKKDEGGRNMKECLMWKNSTPLTQVNKTLADMKNSIIDGQTHHALDTTHTYGKPSTQGFYSMAECLSEFNPSLVRRDMDVWMENINSLRMYVKKKVTNGQFSLEELYEDMQLCDTDRSCFLNIDQVLDICKQYHVFIDLDAIEPLLVILKVLRSDRTVEYRKFLALLDVNSPFPNLTKDQYVLPPEYVTSNFAQSKEPQKNEAASEGLAAALFQHSQQQLIDLERVATKARTLISPSLHTQYGLDYRDFYQPRKQCYIWRLFSKLHPTMTKQVFCEVFQEALQLDNTGGVCVDTFNKTFQQRQSGIGQNELSL